MGLKRVIPAAAVVAGALATAAPAIAAPNTYCVGKPECVGAASPDFQAALDAAKSHAGPDRVELGAGEFSTGGEFSYASGVLNPVEIVGSGAGVTRIATTKAGDATTLYLRRGTISDVEIAGPPSHDLGDETVALKLTGHAERLKISGGWTNVVLGKGASIASSTLTGGGADPERPAVLVDADAASLSDSTVDGLTMGVIVRGLGNLRVDRSTVAAVNGFLVRDGGEADLHDSLITGKGGGGKALEVLAKGDSASATATNVTIVGVGTNSSVGLSAIATSGAGLDAVVTARNAVITNVASPTRREAFGGSAYVYTDHAAFPAAIAFSNGPGESDHEGYLGEPTGFVDAPGGDYRLAAGSPLIDAGLPAPPGGLGAFDRDGLARSVDGNGDGAAAPDIGAFEYQPAGAPGEPGGPGGPGGGGSGGGGPGGPSAPAGDLTAPVLSSLKLTRKRFRVGRAATARVASARKPKRKRGTAFRFRLSEDAQVRIALSRRVHGKRRPAGSLRRAGHKGLNRIAFSGRVGKRALRPGRYRAAITATDAAGHRSKTRRVRFVVVR